MRKTILILLLGIAIGESFLFNIDLSYDSALKKGGALTKNTDSYLYDSFRTEILTPTFAAIHEALRRNHMSDILVEFSLGCLFVLSIPRIIALALIRHKLKKTIKVKREATRDPGVWATCTLSE